MQWQAETEITAQSTGRTGAGALAASFAAAMRAMSAVMRLPTGGCSALRLRGWRRSPARAGRSAPGRGLGGRGDRVAVQEFDLERGAHDPQVQQCGAGAYPRALAASSLTNELANVHCGGRHRDPGMIPYVGQERCCEVAGIGDARATVQSGGGLQRQARASWLWSARSMPTRPTCFGRHSGSMTASPHRRSSTLDEVTFMNSSAVSVLAAAHHDAAAADGGLRMAALSAPVKRGVEVGLGAIIPAIRRFPRHSPPDSGRAEGGGPELGNG